MKHSFDLPNESNTDNGSDDVILMKVDSSDIQQKINKTRVSTTNEINNNNAAKDHSHTTKYSNNRTKQYNNEKKEQQKKNDKNDRKKRSPSKN